MTMSMQPYGGRHRGSGVVAYAMDADWIAVEFPDGCYLYDSRQPGIDHVLEMQRCARAGAGLATYINRHVRDAYAARLW